MRASVKSWGYAVLAGLLCLGALPARAEGTAAALVAKVCYSNQQINKRASKLLDGSSSSFPEIQSDFQDLLGKHLANAQDMRTAFALFATNPGRTGPTASPGFYDATANSCARANRRLRKILVAYSSGLSSDDAQRYATTLDTAAGMFAPRR